MAPHVRSNMPSASDALEHEAKIQIHECMKQMQSDAEGGELLLHISTTRVKDEDVATKDSAGTDRMDLRVSGRYARLMLHEGGQAHRYRSCSDPFPWPPG